MVFSRTSTAIFRAAPTPEVDVKKRKGQALIEYVLLVALLSTATLVYVKFYGKEVLGNGLRALKGRMGDCISHTNRQCKSGQ